MSYQEAADWLSSSESKGSTLAWPAAVLRGQVFPPLVSLAFHLLPPAVYFLWPSQHLWPRGSLESWSLQLSSPHFTSEDSPERHGEAKADTGQATPGPTHLAVLCYYYGCHY